MSKKSVRAAIGAAGLLAGGLVALASAVPASATATGCVLTQAQHSASAVCTSGTGQYRVAAKCEDPMHGTVNTYYGPWVGVGGTSAVNCPTLGGYTWYETSATIQKR
ncbi:MAG: hypothetical protein JO144_04805 [Actinobacteria bacterium]|nr:hypothetical protein [Actinomycetota bacterium]